MSVATNVRHYEGAYVYEQVPPGTRPWYAYGQVTGGAIGGVQDVVVEFNPTSRREFMPYVVLTHVGVKVGTAAPNPANCVAQLDAGEWLYPFNSGDRIVVATIPLVPVESNTDYSGVFNGAVNCWRVRQGTNGSLTIRTNEVANSVMSVNLAGFISDNPLVADERLRA